MPKIICTLANASTEINGIAFVPHDDGIGVISADDVKEPAYSLLLSIPGYIADGVSDTEPPKVEPEPVKKETAAERKARLKAEQEAEDAAAAEKAEAERLANEEAAKVEQTDTVVAPESTDEAGDEVF